MGFEDLREADAHYRFVGDVLEVHGKSFINAVAIIADSVATVKPFACILGPVFIDCHRYSFNLEMKDFLSYHPNSF